MEAIVFDFDGVIIDTETPDFATWQEEFRAHGVELDRDLWTGFIGWGIGQFDVHGHLEDLAGRALDMDAVRARRRRNYLERVHASPVLPGVLDYFAEARETGMKIGVASSSSREWVQGHLERLGLAEWVDSVKTRDDVSAAKPDPELYLASLDALGVSAGRAVAIEDSAIGMTAAVAAGLFCVVVPNPMTEGMDTDRAHLRLRSLADMPLQTLLGIAAA